MQLQGTHLHPGVGGIDLQCGGCGLGPHHLQCRIRSGAVCACMSQLVCQRLGRKVWQEHRLPAARNILRAGEPSGKAGRREACSPRSHPPPTLPLTRAPYLAMLGASEAGATPAQKPIIACHIHTWLHSRWRGRAVSQLGHLAANGLDMKPLVACHNHT